AFESGQQPSGSRSWYRGSRTQKANNAGGGKSFRPQMNLKVASRSSRREEALIKTWIHSALRIPHSNVPLAEQFRRRFAKPQRLVRFQHGIPFSIAELGNGEWQKTQRARRASWLLAGLR